MTGFPVFRPSISAWLRATAASLGDFGPARGDWEKELADARAHGDRFTEAAVTDKRAETKANKLRLDSPPAEVDPILADFATGTSAFEGIGARPYLARGLRAWGETLRRIGRSEEGDEKLRRALALFDEMGIDREAAEVRAELSGIPVMPLQMVEPDAASGTTAGKGPTAN
jgi:hypothetical protein